MATWQRSANAATRTLAGTAICALAATVVAALPGVAFAAPGAPRMLDVTPDGRWGNDNALGGTTQSTDGRYVAFASFASNLVPGDSNNKLDVFVRDTVAGTTTLVSVGAAGRPGNGPSADPSISLDGRYVAFDSTASDLVPDDTNGSGDVFVRDLQAGTTTRVSVTADGAAQYGASQLPAISGDGRYVGFESAGRLVPDDTDHRTDVYVYDRVTGTPQRVTVNSAGEPADTDTYLADVTLSADGRFVAFDSRAANLVPGDTNGVRDVFVRDLRHQTTRLVSARADGAPGASYSENPSMSADGRYIAFESLAGDLPDAATSPSAERVYVRDTLMNVTTREDLRAPGVFMGARQPQLSADGRYLALQAQSGRAEDNWSGRKNVYVRDRQTGTLTAASHRPTGGPALVDCYDISLSADGRHVAFLSDDGRLAPANGGAVLRRPNVYATTLTD